MRALLPLRLAIADLLGERRLTLCAALSVAAVLAPLLVLLGLRTGAVEGMRAAVLRDPLAREILSLTSGSYDAAFLDALRARPDVSHVAPRTRQVATSLLLEAGERQGRAAVVPSLPGDPLLPAAPDGPDRVIPSAALAARLGVEAGMTITGRLARVREDGTPERRALDLHVQAVAPPGAAEIDTLFVPLPLAEDIEDWQEGRDPEHAGARTGHAGFRAYAARIEDVPAIVAALAAQGIETRSRVREIAPILQIDRALGRLLLAIGVVAGTGMVLSLGAGLWANVERKRRLLAGLRLMGLRRGAMVAVPVIQAAAIGLTGGALGAAAALATGAAINAGLGGVALDRKLSILPPAAILLAIAAATLAGMIAAALAGWQAARIAPHEALRGP